MAAVRFACDSGSKMQMAVVVGVGEMRRSILPLLASGGLRAQGRVCSAKHGGRAVKGHAFLSSTARGRGSAHTWTSSKVRRRLSEMARSDAPCDTRSGKSPISTAAKAGTWPVSSALSRALHCAVSPACPGHPEATAAASLCDRDLVAAQHATTRVRHVDNGLCSSLPASVLHREPPACAHPLSRP